MSGSQMDNEETPTRADVEAMRAWTNLWGFDPTRDERVGTTSSDGRIIIQTPSAEAARQVEETALAREEGHRESRAGLMRTMGEALARGHAAGPGPWAPNNPATEKGRDDLRRAGFEERHNGKSGTVWVRSADGATLKPQAAHFVVVAELGLSGGRS